MLRRLAVVVTCAAVSGFGVALPANATPGTTAFTLDLMRFAIYGEGYYGHRGESPTQARYSDVTSEPSGDGVRLVAADDTAVALTPPAGQQFVAGTTFPVAGTATQTSGAFELPDFCEWGTASGSGQATVLDAVYADGALTSLAADVTWACPSMTLGENAVSAIRVASEVPFSLLRFEVVDGPLFAEVPSTVPFTVRVENAGSAAATLGTAAVRFDYMTSYAVTADGCDGTVLPPGASCDIGLTFGADHLGHYGWHDGLVNVPISGYPRASGIAGRLGGRAVAMPPVPQGVTTYRAVDGVGVALRSAEDPYGWVTQYEVARRLEPGMAWSVLASVPAGAQGYVDTTLAPGGSAEYAVRALGPLGASDYTAPLAATRPASPDVTGDVDAIVIESEGTHPPAGVVVGGEGVTFDPEPLALATKSTDAMSSARVMVPLVAGPGVYEVADSDVHHIALSARSCDPFGQLTVTTALYDAELKPVAYTADFVGTCNTRPFAYSVRYRSATPYQAITVTEPTETWESLVGSPADRAFTLTSSGTAPVTFGGTTITGTSAAEFQVVANECAGQTLGTGAACTVTVRATPAAQGVRTAVLSVGTDTAHGQRRVPLAVRGANVPGMPYPIELARVVGRAKLTFAAVDDGGSPVTSFRVYRSAAGGPWDFLGSIAANYPYYVTYLDDTAVPGTTYTYGVTAVNAVGEGPKRTTAAGRAPRGEVLFSHGATDANWGVYAQNERHTGEAGDMRFDVLPPDTDHYTLAVSPDGRSLLYAGPSDNGYGLWRRGFGAGDQPTLLTTLDGHEFDPAWSPDGQTIAFTRLVGDAYSVWAMPAAGGTPVQRATGAYDPAWLSDSESLVVVDAVSNPSRLLRVPATGAKYVIGGSTAGRYPAVSPDGAWLAFSRWGTSYSSSVPSWQLVVMPVGGATTPAFVQSNADKTEPAWRSDGRAILYTLSQDGSEWVNGIGWTGSAFGDGDPFNVSEGGQERGAAYRTLGVHLTSVPRLTRSSATIGFAVSHPAAGETTTCSLDGAAPTACVSPWRGSGLSTGRHTLVVRTKVSGLLDTVAAHTWTVDATAPTLRFTAPAAVALTSSVSVGYVGTDAGGVASYDVRYRTASATSPYTGYVYPATWQRTTARSRSLTARPGTEVCFSVRARDTLGNVSAWTSDRCVAVAYDDRHLSVSAGWARRTASGAYLGTYSGTTTRAAVLSKSNVTAARIYLVVTRCAGCGSVEVRVGSVVFGRVSLAGTGAYRVVLALPKRSAAVTGTLRVVALGTAPVRIDGIAIHRR